MIGIRERDTKSGCHVFEIDFIADAMKRDEDILDELACGFPGGRTGRMWRQEMLRDRTVASGMGVYSEEFNP